MSDQYKAFSDWLHAAALDRDLDGAFVIDMRHAWEAGIEYARAAVKSDMVRFPLLPVDQRADGLVNKYFAEHSHHKVRKQTEPQ